MDVLTSHFKRKEHGLLVVYKKKLLGMKKTDGANESARLVQLERNQAQIQKPEQVERELLHGVQEAEDR
eukprot:11207144-Prorocentrum_lima.AAC.1